MQSVSAVFSYGSNFRSLEFPTFRKFFVSAHDHIIPHPRNNYHPHILSHRMLALLSLLLLTVKIAAVSLVAVGPIVNVEASAITSSTVISLANQARSEAGLGTLTANSQLASAAQAKANDMLAKQYFSHNTPSGDTPWTFIKASGYSYVTAGENLAIDFTEAESVQTAWMNSPGHRANIMNKTFQEIGIGIAKGMYNGHQTTIVVQMFGTPIAQKVSLPATPTPVAQPAAPQPAPAQVTPAQVAPAPAQQQPVAQQQAAAPQNNATVAPSAPVAIEQQSALPSTPVGQQPVEIKSTETSLQGNQIYINVTASSEATKLLANYGTSSIMLDPAGNNEWYGYIPLASLNSNINLLVYAFDINGNFAKSEVSQFSSSLNPTLESGNVEGASISVLGKVINPKEWEQNVILAVLGSLILCLIIAIAIRRHVQHVGLVANTAFVAMLAAFMLMV